MICTLNDVSLAYHRRAECKDHILLHEDIGLVVFGV